MLAPVDDPRLRSIGWVRSLESDITGATDRSAAVRDAAAVGPSAGGWATRRAERNPCAVGPLPFCRPSRVIRRGDGAREVNPPVEMRCVGRRHCGVLHKQQQKLGQRIIQPDNSQKEGLLTVPDHVAKHGGVSRDSTRVVSIPGYLQQ